MTFVAQNLTLGQLNAIVKKLGGEARAKRFLRGELCVSEIKTPARLPVWRTIRLGTHKSLDAYKRALEEAGFRSVLDSSMLCEQKERTINLVVLTSEDLGFMRGTEFREICKKALAQGFELCPKEAGLALRLQYINQTAQETLVVAHENKALGCSDATIIKKNDKELIVAHHKVPMKGFFYEYEFFVFVRP